MTKELEKIISAAILQDGRIICVFPPGRHHDIIRLIYHDTGKTVNGDQGFMTSKGRFIDRQEARTLAMENGQCPEPRHCSDLFSEDLW